MNRFIFSALLTILLFDKIIINETSAVSQNGAAKLEPTKQFSNGESVATNKIDQSCESVVKLLCFKVGSVDHSAESKSSECEKKLEHLFVMEIPRFDAKNYIPISMALEPMHVRALISSLDVAFDKLSYATRWPYKTPIENNQMKTSSLRHDLESVLFGVERTKFYTTPIPLPLIAKEYTLSFIVNHINEVEQCLSYMEKDHAAHREEIIDKLHAVLLAKEVFQEYYKRIYNVIEPILKENSPIPSGKNAEKILNKLNGLLGKFDTLQANYLMTLTAVNEKLMKYYEKWAQFLIGYGLSKCADLTEFDKNEKAQAAAIKKAQKTTRENGEQPDKSKSIEKPKKWNFNPISFFKNINFFKKFFN